VSLLGVLPAGRHDRGLWRTGGLTQARQRLGDKPVEEVFTQVAVPPATEDTEGAFLGPWRKMSMDGLEWDVPAAATAAGIDPDRVKFRRTVRIIRRRAADPAFSPDQRQRVLARVVAGITDPRHLNKRRERSYPRVVKRARHNHYPVKKPGQHGTHHDAPPAIKLSNPILTRDYISAAA